MNGEQTIALWQRCEDARAAAYAAGKDANEAHAAASAIWNGWANELLVRKAEMKDAKTWQIDEVSRQPDNGETEKWLDEASAIFYAVKFFPSELQDEADSGKQTTNIHQSSKLLSSTTSGFRFDGWIFPGAAIFDHAEFPEGANFNNARFLERTSFYQARFEECVVFRAASFETDADFRDVKFSEAVCFEHARFHRLVRFRGTQFHGRAGFDVAQFQGEAGFGKAQFYSRAWFGKARFWAKADFGGTRFQGKAGFGKAQFDEVAEFTEAHFQGVAEFTGARFENIGHSVNFPRARFESYAGFSNALFRTQADFFAIRSESAFDLGGATFEALPSFIQATFKEPPRSDHLTLVTPLACSHPKENLAGAWTICRDQCRQRQRGVTESARAEARDANSKFRALKALAIKAHDSEREHLFHKGELRARRIAEDEGRTLFYGNVLYDLFSDFGRSIWRPTVSWLFWAVALAGFYALSAIPRTTFAPIVVPGVFGGIPVIAPPPDNSCAHPFLEGLYLAARNGFPLSGARDQRVIDSYSCLYVGSSGQPGVFPDIPDWISCVELVYTPVSVILIFLFALALRNQFKIK